MLPRFFSLLEDFRADQRGAFMAMFAIMALVLVALSGAVVDFVSVEQVRTRAQVALDSAALALQPKIFEVGATTTIKTSAQNLLVERLADATITATVDSATVDTKDGWVKLQATLSVPMYFVRLVGVPDMTVKVVSQATRGSQDVEVAVALDITGSMAGTKITDLISAANSLVDIVVKDQQTPTYTKMALVPYSMGVNVGSRAASIRGPVTRPAITGAAWLSTAVATITRITASNPAKVTTSAAHGFVTGNTVFVTGLTGSNLYSANGNYKYLPVTKTTDTEFAITGVDSSAVGSNYTGSGSARKCITDSCEIVVTSPSHGLIDGETITISGVQGLTQINDKTWVIGKLSDDAFALKGTDARTNTYGNYTSGGLADCYRYGCQYYYFTNQDGGANLHVVSTCVTERVGANQYTDAAPTTTYVGKNYPSTSNPCISSEIVPLSDNKTTLHNSINALKAGGSTAGQIGLAWAWYMVSPNFSYLWPTASRPAAYGTRNLLKVVILMTDGEFNTSYYNGVISKDSLNGSGANNTHINHDASNGGAYTQATAQCAAMKKGGDGVSGTNDDIVVYTVGFDIADQQNAKTLMSGCATDSTHAYLANTGTDLKEAFKKIGENITSLRLSQ